MLKHHADARTDRRQFAVVHHNARARRADLPAVQIDLPGVGSLQPVDATEQR
jgi:hypothetical protein